jgi:hypothetical protein
MFKAFVRRIALLTHGTPPPIHTSRGYFAASGASGSRLSLIAARVFSGRFVGKPAFLQFWSLVVNRRASRPPIVRAGSFSP